MICEVCHQKNADIVFKTVTGGQVATRAMCLDCAHNIQQDMMKMCMALGFKPGQVEEPRLKEEPRVDIPRFVCAHCGRPFTQLGEHTMAGCPSCYEAMEGELAAHFDQGKAGGTEPLNEQAAMPEGPVSLNELKVRLMEAVIREEYESAAALRDEIRASSGAGD